MKYQTFRQVVRPRNGSIKRHSIAFALRRIANDIDAGFVPNGETELPEHPRMFASMTVEGISITVILPEIIIP